MEQLLQKLETKLKEERARCSTNNSYSYAYSYGLEYAITELKIHMAMESIIKNNKS